MARLPKKPAALDFKHPLWYNICIGRKPQERKQMNEHFCF